jgi:hypothetical protein
MSEQSEIEALKKELSDFKEKYAKDRMEYLNFKIDFGQLRDTVAYHYKRLGENSTFFGGRTSELRARVDALEATVFKRLGDFGAVEKIIGPPNDQTPPDLDKPKTFPRR